MPLLPGFTVMVPSFRVHVAAPPFALSQASRPFPLNSIMASDGASAEDAQGLTTGGTGFHTSVSFGSPAFANTMVCKMVMVVKRQSNYFMVAKVVFNYFLFRFVPFCLATSFVSTGAEVPPPESQRRAGKKATRRLKPSLHRRDGESPD